ncbi:MAG: cytidine deaminase, partial [Anaerolineales bacterium]
IYDGVNVENAAYPDGICAERTAVVKAVSEGEREFVAIAVATVNGGLPCGSCRQFLAEFGLDVLVLVADGQGSILKRATVRELLPDSFGPAQLTK